MLWYIRLMQNIVIIGERLINVHDGLHHGQSERALSTSSIKNHPSFSIFNSLALK